MSGEIEEAGARARAQGDPPEVDDYGWGFVSSGDDHNELLSYRN